jgi:hypothetical protein
MKLLAVTEEETAMIKAYRKMTPRQRLLLLSAMIHAAHDDQLTELAWMIDKVVNLHRPNQD